jgi:hypothetical protein
MNCAARPLHHMYNVNDAFEAIAASLMDQIIQEISNN